MDLYLGDELIKRLDLVEAREFFRHLRQEEAKNGHLFKSSKDWKQITELSELEAHCFSGGRKTKTNAEY